MFTLQPDSLFAATLHATLVLLFRASVYDLQQCDSLREFKWLLKTHVFGDHGTL